MNYYYKIGMAGFYIFQISANRPHGIIGHAICHQCEDKYLAIRRTDRFCSNDCRRSFLKELRDFEKKFGKLKLDKEDKEKRKFKPKQIMCKAFNCSKRFNTHSNNQKYCSDKCKAKAALFLKHKDDKRWLAKQKIRK